MIWYKFLLSLVFLKILVFATLTFFNMNILRIILNIYSFSAPYSWTSYLLLPWPSSTWTFLGLSWTSLYFQHRAPEHFAFCYIDLLQHEHSEDNTEEGQHSVSHEQKTGKNISCNLFTRVVKYHKCHTEHIFQPPGNPKKLWWWEWSSQFFSSVISHWLIVKVKVKVITLTMRMRMANLQNPNLDQFSAKGDYDNFDNENDRRSFYHLWWSFSKVEFRSLMMRRRMMNFQSLNLNKFSAKRDDNHFDDENENSKFTKS